MSTQTFTIAQPTLAPIPANSVPVRKPEDIEVQRTTEDPTVTSVAEERDRKVFMQELNKFMSEIGKPLSKIPIMGYKELDLYQLFKEVTAYGGFNEVVKNVGTWSKIWKRLGNFDPSITDSSFRLKKNYERYLLEYEYKCFPDHRQQAIELEKQMQMRKSQTDNPGSITEKTKSDKAKKQPKRKPTVSTKDVVRDKNGAVKMPLALGDLTVENLGVITAKPHFITEKHIYPVGFASSRIFSSMINPELKVRYISSIVDGGDKPQFVVTASDDELNPIISHSPSGAWRTVLKRVNEKTTDESKKQLSVSGTLRFGLANPIVASLIRELPGMEKAKEILATPNAPADAASAIASASSATVRKRKTVTTPSSSSSDDSSDDLDYMPPKVHRTLSSNTFMAERELSLSPVDYEDTAYYYVKTVHFATRDEVDDLESAVATLEALKYCAVY